MEYKFSQIEKKWQKYWEENQVFRVENSSLKPKYYVLDMFPYPSGAGLHVGHPLGYIASDIFSRYKRLMGFNVLHPMGFDAFGLPAEQYAIETGQHPAATTEKNIQRYKEQLKNIGFCFDWNREVRTCDPEYYKWTQWIFLKLFNSWYNPETDKAEPIETLIDKFQNKSLPFGAAKAQWAFERESANVGGAWNYLNEKEKSDILLNYRLAYLAYSDVNWCPALGTVLANDEVKEGKSERGGHPVIRKKMRQWFLRITAYADRLLNGLENLDWPLALKEMQRNWIGRSEGALIDFYLKPSGVNPSGNNESGGGTPSPVERGPVRQRTDSSGRGGEAIKVFTTRPDTIFGATFLVIAPEHELVEKITTRGQEFKIQKYLEYVQSRSEVERQQEKSVTGEFTGAYAINPFTNKKIPIWIAEYVLAGYGTGAIMAVPSDDDRDNAFAKKFGLEIIDVIDKSKYPGSTRDDKEGILINSGFINGMEVPVAIKAIINKAEEMGIGKRKINYKMRDAGFSRQRYWGEPFPIVYRTTLSAQMLAQSSTGGLPSIGEGVPTHKAFPEEKVFPFGENLGGSVIPFPLPENELPVILPEVESYKPTGDGESPLAVNLQWKKLPDGSIRETDTMPGYAGSSWYYLRYMDPKNKNEFVSKEAEHYWKNVDLYIGGSEHAVGHLLYARLWHKVLFDLGYVSTEEPFQKLINQGMIQGRSSIVYRIAGTNQFVSQGLRARYDATALHVDVNMVENDILDLKKFRNWREEYKDAEFILEEGKYYCGYEIEKMSKRWHNVVNPDDVVAKYGADCFRMYEMFLGPIEQHKPWDTKGMEGVSRFLKKFWKLFHLTPNPRLASPSSGATSPKEMGKVLALGEDLGEVFSVSSEIPTAEELKILHKTIKKIQEDTERFSFNTGVSNFMICINELSELKCNKRAILEPMVILIAPYAPHFAEELWEMLGNKPSVNNAQFPIFEEKYLVENVFTYPVSFNGKMRFKIDLPADLTVAEIEKAALAHDQSQKWLEGKTPKKVIVVPGKIVNVVF